ncbi:MAG TPA: linear amide C-N hydrolase [Verrucomicrobiae bacterium]|nr:linear amide C-N hydrolase [Verrucomicrobiae bacterium]
MKSKTAGTLVAMSLSVLACGALLAGVSARACTVFCYSRGDTVLAGRSFDIPDNPNLGMLLVPATNSMHGWFCCARFDYPWADGMNDQGLFAAVADVPALYTSRSSTPPADLQTFVSGLLGNCATVDEAIKWCRKQPTPSLGAAVNHSDRGDYTFVTPQHILVADRSGDSVVLEWPQGKLKMTRKRGGYQLMTNFLLADPEAGSYPCARFTADSRILDKAAGSALQTCRQILETTSQQGTRYSLICDLAHGDVYVYLRRGFDQPKTFHLVDELQEGRHELDLDHWFGRPDPEPLSPPPVIGPSTFPASEILQRALTARGGEKAAAKIRSLDGKGTIDIGWGCVSASPFEFLAMRPNRYRAVIDIGLPGDLHPGQYVEGFDGRTGWNSYAGSRDILQGPRYELRKDAAAFFGWYDQPEKSATAECPGEAQFDGKLCYALKVVSPSSHLDSFEYYDTTNFLLAGTFSHDPTGSGWLKTTFGDYRAFDGFLMPTRIVSQGEAGTYPVQFSSLEVNTVKDRDLRMATKVARLKH